MVVQSGADCTLPVKIISAGSAACIADLATFPLDVAKVRLQVQGEGSAASSIRSIVRTAQSPHYNGLLGTIMTMAKQEGPKSLYNGLSAGLQRQMCFASVRIGLYDNVKKFYSDLFNSKAQNGSVAIRIIAGISTGGMAVICAQPTDVVKVRMQAQGMNGGVKRYTGAFHAYKTIGHEEGFRGLWKGTIPNIARNAIVNAAELVCYDCVKEFILNRQLMRDAMPCHFVSAFGAGFCATVVASPVDVVKTRFMNSAPGQYTGALECANKMFREGGFKAFYKGFIPSYIRLGSWNIVMFVTFEQLKIFFTNASNGAPSRPVELVPLLANNYASPAPLAVRWESSLGVRNVDARWHNPEQFSLFDDA